MADQSNSNLCNFCQRQTCNDHDECEKRIQSQREAVADVTDASIAFGISSVTNDPWNRAWKWDGCQFCLSAHSVSNDCYRLQVNDGIAWTFCSAPCMAAVVIALGKQLEARAK